MTSDISCISCDLNAFNAPPFQDQPYALKWLERLPGLNYQCPIRAQVVFALMKEKAKQTGTFDPIKHCFLAVGEMISAYVNNILTNTCDVHICWVHLSGKMYSINADNQSEQFCAPNQPGSRPYSKRWIGKEPQVIELQSETLTATQLRDVIKKFASPYQIRYYAPPELHHVCDSETQTHCLIKTVSNDLAGIIGPKQEQPDDPIAAIPEPIAGPMITSVLVTTRSTQANARPNRADVRINSNGTFAVTDVDKMMHIVDAYAILNANPTSAPVPVSMIISSFNSTIEFFAEPRMLQQLALLRIWREHYLKSEFQVQSGNEDLPITITRED